jgi:hypothetical protein
MLTGCGVQAFIPKPQSLNGLAAENVRLDDFINVGKSDAAIPNRLGINH